MKTLEGRTFDPQRAERVVSSVRGDGALSAFYETFRTTTPQVGTSALGPLPDDGIKVYWNKRSDGPPYLLLGSEVMASTSNVTSSIFDVRYVHQNLGGYGSELVADVRLGYLTQTRLAFYHPVASSKFFIQPQLESLREPVYMWRDQKRVSERSLQKNGGGLDVGATLSPHLQVATEYRTSTVHWAIIEGSDLSPSPHLSGRTESVAEHLVYTTRTAAVASPRGSQVDVRVGYLFDTTASRNAAFADMKARRSFTIAGSNLLSFSTEIQSYFRGNVPDALRFKLGGPLRLYSSSLDEYRGTDVELARAIYLHRVARLPTGIGQGVYVTGGYEQGNVWSPEHPAVFAQDGFGGVLLSTPLGAVTFGGAIGDDNHRKLFFTFGKLF